MSLSRYHGDVLCSKVVANSVLLVFRVDGNDSNDIGIGLYNDLR